MKRLALALIGAAIALMIEPRPVYLDGYDMPAPKPAPPRFVSGVPIAGSGTCVLTSTAAVTYTSPPSGVVTICTGTAQ